MPFFYFFSAMFSFKINIPFIDVTDNNTYAFEGNMNNPSTRRNSIGRKILNYKEALRDINIEEYLKNHLTYVTSIN
jgi:hypothetical protein